MVVGCQDEETFLKGSVSSRYDLTYERVRARLYDSELAIEYVRADDQVPVRVTVEAEETSSFRATTYDLGERGDVRGRVDQVKLPPMESGSITLEEYSEQDGARVKGTFDSRLQAADSLVTLRGKFVGTLEVIDKERGYVFDTGTDAGDAGDVAGDVGSDVAD